MLVRAGAATGALFACAVLLGWHAGHVVVAPGAAVEPEAWQLPQIKKSDPEKDLAALAARKPWSTSAAPTPSKAAAATNWRFAGVVQRGDERYALVVSGTDAAAKVSYLRTGETLPDGSVLVEITADSATSASDPASPDRHTYRLHGAKP